MKKLDVLISVDWEGTDLNQENLRRIKKFKKDWKVPLTHYLNAAYYSNPRTCALNVTEKINSILEEEDELGLHLHAPKHLVAQAGVAFKSAPCFSAAGDYNAGEEQGQEVMLHTYTQKEVNRLIKHSKSVLTKKGFQKIESFRAGGWMSNEGVFESLVENGFKVESSATDASLLDGSSWEGDNLQRYISIIWGDINQDSKPYKLQTSQGELLEIPNNLGAIDYWKDSWVENLVNRCVENASQNERHLAVVNTHQETADEHWHKLEAFLEALIARKDCEVSFVTNEQVAKTPASA